MAENAGKTTPEDNTEKSTTHVAYGDIAAAVISSEKGKDLTTATHMLRYDSCSTVIAYMIF